VNTLAAVETPIFSEDHIKAILDRLLEDYDPYFTFIASQLEAYSIKTLKHYLA